MTQYSTGIWGKVHKYACKMQKTIPKKWNHERTDMSSDCRCRVHVIRNLRSFWEFRGIPMGAGKIGDRTKWTEIGKANIAYDRKYTGTEDQKSRILSVYIWRLFLIFLLLFSNDLCTPFHKLGVVLAFFVGKDWQGWKEAGGCAVDVIANCT